MVENLTCACARVCALMYLIYRKIDQIVSLDSKVYIGREQGLPSERFLGRQSGGEDTSKSEDGCRGRVERTRHAVSGCGDQLWWQVRNTVTTKFVRSVGGRLGEAWEARACVEWDVLYTCSLGQ